MTQKRWFIPLLAGLMLVFLMAAGVQAQTPLPTTTPENPNAYISWPPPVYVLRGQFTVRGSANLPNMQNYFIEFRPLPADLGEQEADFPWSPAILPSTAAVQDDVLGVWDTRIAQDGVYELRLTINVRGGQPVYHIVSPLRVENVPPPFAVTATSEAPVAQPTLPAASTPLPAPTLAPTNDPTPRVTAVRSANVRRGDGTQYDVVGALREGESARIVGISSFGTGWYVIELPSGGRGFISPSVVSVSGDVANLARIDPPPPPTATPIPATPTPATNVNLVAGNFRFDPPTPTCNQTFNVYIDIANFGTTANTTTGTISVQDFRRADGSFQTSTFGAVPIIQPGTTVNVGPIPLTVGTFYAEEHRLVIAIDSGNAIFETNEGDNVREAIYVLQKGACP